ncbi:MAG: hypothetical protein K0Q94_2837 [Paenibacillus sp.]|nr:hypothetical protein [Paenibacillus sp.]
MRAEEYPEDDYRRNDPRFQGENYVVARKKFAPVGKPGQAFFVYSGKASNRFPSLRKLPGVHPVYFLKVRMKVTACE